MGAPGLVSAKACVGPTWHPAQRRRERGSGSNTEPWNLSSAGIGLVKSMPRESRKPNPGEGEY